MRKTRQLRRGIYLLPTLFTVGNLLCGYSSVVKSYQGAVEQAAIFIIIAGVLDGLDGRIARLTGTTTEFGVEFDSLADIVSFGVAPAMLAYRWGLHAFDRLGWLIAFIFVVCAAMRLARYNIQTGVGDKRHFAGLPSPAAAGSLAAVAYAFPEVARSDFFDVALGLLVATLALLMISRVRYRSFKELDLRNRRSYVYVLPLAAIMVAIGIYPKWALLILAAIYLISAPATSIWAAARHLTAGASASSVGVEREGVVDETSLH
jgi:CDP-diacylglycerol--serine O-phosphatidyltransferase